MSLYIQSIGDLDRVFAKTELTDLYGQTGRFTDRGNVTTNYTRVASQQTMQAITAYYVRNASENNEGSTEVTLERGRWVDWAGMTTTWTVPTAVNNPPVLKLAPVGEAVLAYSAADAATNPPPAGIVSSYISSNGVDPGFGFWVIVRGPCEGDVLAGDTVNEGDPITVAANGYTTTGVAGTNNIYGYALETVTAPAADTPIRIMIDVPFL